MIFARSTFALMILFVAACQDGGRNAPTSASATTLHNATVLGKNELAVRARLSKETMAAVDRAPVRVLVPGDATLERGILIVEGSFYAFSTRNEETTYAVSATHESKPMHDLTANPGNVRVRGLPAFASENEATWSVTWVENGTSYVVDLECSSAADARCHSAEEVTKYANALVLVGGDKH